MRKRRTSYETYKGWVKKYGVSEEKMLSEAEFKKEFDGRKLKLIERNESTRNLSKSIANDTAFQYDYKVGVAIRKAFNEYHANDKDFKKITIREARNFQNFKNSNLGGETFEQLQGMGAAFWDMVSAEYYKEKEKSGNATVAKKTIAQTIFGSP